MSDTPSGNRQSANQMWGGRFVTGPDQIMEEINASIDFDKVLYAQDIAGSKAHARMLIKQNIIVNAIAPGPFPTYMLSLGVGGAGDPDAVDWDALGKGNPRGRVGTAEDIAGLAIFLSSRAGAFTVGDVITCDGGAVVS